MLAAVLEEPAGVLEAPVDEGLGVREVDRRDPQRAGRRQDDEVGVVAVAFDVVDEPALREQADRVEGHREGAARRFVEGARVAGREDVDAAGAELDRVRDRRVVRDAAVHEEPVAPGDGGQDAGDRGAREDRVLEVAGGEPQLLAGEDVDRDDVERDRQILQPFAVDVPRDEAPQARGGDEVVADADEAEQAGDRVEREGAPAPEPAPDAGEGVRGGDRLRARRDERAVEGARGGPDEEVGRDAPLVEGAEHPDLDRAETRSSGEDERDGRPAGGGHVHERRARADAYGTPAEVRPGALRTLSAL